MIQPKVVRNPPKQVTRKYTGDIVVFFCVPLQQNKVEEYISQIFSQKDVTGVLSVGRWDVSCKKDEDISYAKHLHEQNVADTGEYVNFDWEFDVQFPVEILKFTIL